LKCGYNELADLDVSNNPLIWDLDCQHNNIASINIENNLALQRFYCNDNQLTNLNVTNNTSLTWLQAGNIGNSSGGNNVFSTVDISHNTNLTYLELSSCELSSINVWNNTNLRTLAVSINNLSSLDVRNNTMLVSLFCVSNNLSELDLRNCTKLQVISCSNNQISELDLSNKYALTQLYCGMNQLSSLDISNNTALTRLQCDTNYITTLDIRNCNALLELVKNTEPQVHYYIITYSDNEKIDHVLSYDNKVTLITNDDSAHSGTWGNLTWVLDDEGLLTISGSGAMSDFTTSASTDAWRAIKGDIRSVKIESNVTSIGSCAFTSCDSLAEVSIPKTVTRIGMGAFNDCGNLTDIYYSGTEGQWKEVSISEYNPALSTATIHFGEAARFIKYLAKNGTTQTIYLSKSIEEYVFETESDVYNPELAYYLMLLANSSYNKPYMYDSLESLGFKNRIIDSDEYDDEEWFSNYYFSKKILPNGKMLVIITVRGTHGSTEWLLTDFLTGIPVGVPRVHSGFELSKNNLIKNLKGFLGGSLPTSNVVYVLSGHSLGAAVANLTAVSLQNEGVARSDIYDYNFACPDVAKSDALGLWKNPDGQYCNIFNIGDAQDIITYVPGVLGNYLAMKVNPLDVIWTWGKYGLSRWFSRDWDSMLDVEYDLSFDPHYGDNYIDFLRSKQPFSALKTWEMAKIYQSSARVKKMLGIRCPVNVMIYDGNDVPVASVIDGEANYYDSVFGDVIIYTEGDMKVIILPSDQEYDVHLVGTDTGEMSYDVMEVNVASEEISQMKSFESVEIVPGKTMVCNLAEELAVDSVKLFVVDENNKPVSEVQEDGTEKTVIFSGTWGDNLSWVLDADGLLNISGKGGMDSLLSLEEGEEETRAWRPYISSIKSVVINPGITSIGVEAFLGCSKLEKVTIPEGVTSIGWRAFEGCSSLRSVAFPESLTWIDYRAFWDCNSLTGVEIPAGVTDIGYTVFSWCGELKNITVNADNQNYASQNGVLYNKEKTNLICCPAGTVGEYEVPEGVTSISNYAFAGCGNLERVIIPEGVETIGDCAFEGCDSLLTVTIPTSVTDIHSFAFFECSGLTDVYYAGTQEQWNIIRKGEYNYSLSSAVVHYADSTYIFADGNYGGHRYALYSGTKKWSDAKSFCESLGGHLATITSSDEQAFIESLNTDDLSLWIGGYRDAQFVWHWVTGEAWSYTHWGDGEPNDSTAVVSDENCLAIWPAYWNDLNDLNTYETNGFICEWDNNFVGTWGNLTWRLDEDGTLIISGFGSMDDFSIPAEGQEETRAWLLHKGSIKNIEIKNGVSSIGNGAFYNCGSLTNVTIPESITSIGDYSFYSTYELTKVNFPSSLESIGEGAFCDCGLTNLQFPTHLELIGDYAFVFSNNLTNVTIPASVKTIGDGAFDGCHSLMSIVVDDENQLYSDLNGVLANKEKTEIISYPAGKQGSFVIPSSVTGISHRAFAWCSELTSITIPISVTSIGEHAFSGSGLSDVYYQGTKAQWGAIKVDTNNDVLLSARIHYIPTDFPDPDFILPTSLTTIEEEAFAGGTFVYIKLPENAISIGWHAFANCPNLAYIYIPAQTTQIDNQAFGNMQGLTIFGTPGSYAQSYAMDHGFIFRSVLENSDRTVSITFSCDNEEYLVSLEGIGTAIVTETRTFELMPGSAMAITLEASNYDAISVQSPSVGSRTGKTVNYIVPSASETVILTAINNN
jgi:hypothetical protein